MSSLDTTVDSDGEDYDYGSDEHEDFGIDSDNEADNDGITEISFDGLKFFCVLNVEDIEKRQEQEIRCVSSLLSVSRDAAIVLLMRYNWSSMTVQERWFSDEDRVSQESGLVLVPVMRKSSLDTITCRICFENFGIDQMSASVCGHLFCNECWKSYISISIADGAGCLILRCPDPGCRAAVGESMMKLVSREDENRYRNYFMKSYVENNKKIKWCPAPDCNNAIEYTLGSGSYDVACGCSHTFCWNCLEENHRPVDCDMVSKWNFKNSSEGENTNWILANSKPCPKCKKPIEKNQGCMHMTCKAPCSHHFCWLCLGDWFEHGEKTGGFYACNKYEDAKREGKFTEEEKKRQAAKNSLSRYTHYFERWAANESSRKKSIAHLEEFRSVMVNKLSEVQKVPETQLDFMFEAWMQIIECRRVLKWAYAYGYYIPVEEKTKRNFFEFIQGEAEAGLERLHQCAEKEVSEYAKDQNPLTDLIMLQEKLNHLTKVTRKYFEHLIRALEDGLSDVSGIGECEEDEDVLCFLLLLLFLKNYIPPRITASIEIQVEEKELKDHFVRIYKHIDILLR